MQDLAEAYRQTSDNDLIRLHADMGNLTLQAQQALLAEINRRGLSDSHVAETKEQWEQDAAQDAKAEQEKRKKRPVRWAKIFAQLGTILAVTVVWIIAMEALGNLGPYHLSPEAEGVFGEIAGRVAILAAIIAMSVLRGRVLATAIMTVCLYVAVTAYNVIRVLIH